MMEPILIQITPKMVDEFMRRWLDVTLYGGPVEANNDAPSIAPEQWAENDKAYCGKPRK